MSGFPIQLSAMNCDSIGSLGKSNSCHPKDWVHEFDMVCIPNDQASHTIPDKGTVGAADSNSMQIYELEDSMDSDN